MCLFSGLGVLAPELELEACLAPEFLFALLPKPLWDFDWFDELAPELLPDPELPPLPELLLVLLFELGALGGFSRRISS